MTGALLQVEGSDNSVYPFTETGNGFYALASINMNTATQYRLRIANVNSETYLSDYVPFKPTPPIDSLNWVDAGFISAGTLRQQRIFINRNQVPNWLYFYECPLPDKIIPERSDRKSVV